MARTANEIVAEQLGALHLQLVLAQTQAGQAMEEAAKLAAEVDILKAQLTNAKAGISDPPKDKEAEAMPMPMPEAGLKK